MLVFVVVRVVIRVVIVDTRVVIRVCSIVIMFGIVVYCHRS